MSKLPSRGTATEQITAFDLLGVLSRILQSREKLKHICQGMAHMIDEIINPWHSSYLLDRADNWAGLIRDWHPKSAYENSMLVTRREAYRFTWLARLDFLITPPHATPALPHGAMKDAVRSYGYTFLFNLDYTAGVMPVTHVDRELDQLPADSDIKKLNGVARGEYKHYDATAMYGLPVVVQVVGKLGEETVLPAMKRIEDALGGEKKYKPIDIEDID
ncbi:amidase [Apiospora arundinis]|uniref:Amidase n=1 Tax=Apiospora arundinis TaxID=335852 RepID=A0ABR2HPR5_9PEZI